MPGNGEDTATAYTYPSKEQYAAWKDRADEMDMSISEWISYMVEAGWRKFDARVDPDTTNQELRKQRNDLRDELTHCRQRIAKLEDRLHESERAEIRRFVESNPGASYREINQRVIDTAASRTTRHLEDMEGKAIRQTDDGYYPVEDQ